MQAHGTVTICCSGNNRGLNNYLSRKSIDVAMRGSRKKSEVGHEPKLISPNRCVASRVEGPWNMILSLGGEWGLV